MYYFESERLELLNSEVNVEQKVVVQSCNPTVWKRGRRIHV